ncbi:Silent information regulator protein Sir2 [Allomeiothermus silvanus DSM 9946]|uniref:NAD-dependent protein deacylase n=1 Tax=Allomeiothermus silvanus (strain ATCC 700542 / DSM 9946 / NBRC 106475 / NCIMB 13440 / VI-R2) TaxID=526227 RepID=D7BCH6_ALLS1|nr:NAD-dependent deacylase [Allomeiothermus silvanus]ADH62861.1 Silent information regulator protein Sir2 [Allomeiothermus silvanus DSM 9946]
MEAREARRRLKEAKRVAVLTGAGISAPSGIPTFRDAGGLWKDFRIEDYATPEAYRRDPLKVWEWYAWRYANAMQAQPNRAHRLLAELERQFTTPSPHVGDRLTPTAREGSGFLLVTQNVDGLHARAGSTHLVELHGSIGRARCEECGARFPLPDPGLFIPPPVCPKCGGRGRPDVVWFGELLPPGAFERAENAFAKAEVALVVGTSAEIEPAASLGRLASWAGAYLIEINPNQTPLSRLADCSLRMGAIEGLEALLSPTSLLDLE